MAANPIWNQAKQPLPLEMYQSVKQQVQDYMRKSRLEAEYRVFKKVRILNHLDND